MRVRDDFSFFIGDATDCWFKYVSRMILVLFAADMSPFKPLIGLGDRLLFVDFFSPLDYMRLKGLSVTPARLDALSNLREDVRLWLVRLICLTASDAVGGFIGDSES